MAERPIAPPRRDELALGRDGAFSQRSIVYLEDIAELTNDAPQDIEDETLAALGGINNVNILAGKLSEAEKQINDCKNIIAALNAACGILIAENKKLMNRIEDIEQLQTGGFNGG